MKNLYLVLFTVIIATACSKEPTAESILEKSIIAHGGEHIYNSHVAFDFRKIHYEANYTNGNFTLSRQFQDTLNNKIKDVLTNSSFERTINDTVANVTDEWKNKYSNSVNSVIYFFRLPFNLRDPAVNLTYLGKTIIEEQEYYKLKVTFKEESGGEDFTDQFVYWFNSNSYTLDYLAYEYATEGGGKRFRKAINQRDVNGWLLSDYINYKPLDIEVDISDYDTYFEKAGFKKLSEIKNTNVEVKYN